MTTLPDGLAEDAKIANDLESAKFTKDKDAVDVVQPTAKLIGLTKEQLEQYRNDPFWNAVRYSLFVAFWLVWLAMFVGAILIVVLSPKCAEVKWQQKMTTYKIFSLAFKDADNTADSNGGIGDFAGIKEKLGDLKDMGITAVWPTPVLSVSKNELSPEAVVELDLEARLGGEERFKELIKAAHAKDMKVVVDLPLTVDGSQENWAKKMGGAANKGISVVQLNKPEVQQKLVDVVKRLVELGIDGVNIADYGVGADPKEVQKLAEKISQMEGVGELLVFSDQAGANGNQYQVKSLVGAEPEELQSIKEKLHANLAQVKQQSESAHNGSTVWQLGSLDPKGLRVDKLVKDKGLFATDLQRISSAFSLVQLFIPGPVSILYGEELGLLSGAASASKKSNRVVYPWNNGTGLGFSEGKLQTYFSIPSATSNGNFESQEGDPHSPLSVFKTVAKLHQNSDFILGEFEHSKPADIDLYVVKRYPAGSGFYVLAVNWNGEQRSLSNGKLPVELKEAKLSSVEVLASAGEPNAPLGKVDLSEGANPLDVGAYGAIVLEVQ